MKSAEEQRIDEIAKVWAANTQREYKREHETFWEGFKSGWQFWTFWLRVRPSAKDLGGVAATILYLMLVLLAVSGFWELILR